MIWNLNGILNRDTFSLIIWDHSNSEHSWLKEGFGPFEILIFPVFRSSLYFRSCKWFESSPAFVNTSWWRIRNIFGENYFVEIFDHFSIFRPKYFDRIFQIFVDINFAIKGQCLWNVSLNNRRFRNWSNRCFCHDQNFDRFLVWFSVNIFGSACPSALKIFQCCWVDWHRVGVFYIWNQNKDFLDSIKSSYKFWTIPGKSVYKGRSHAAVNQL